MSSRCQSAWVEHRQRRIRLLVERALEDLGVADHVADVDPVPSHQPRREPERRAHHRRVRQDLARRSSRRARCRSRSSSCRSRGGNGPRGSPTDRSCRPCRSRSARRRRAARPGATAFAAKWFHATAERRPGRVVLDDHVRVAQLATSARRSGGASTRPSGACAPSPNGIVCHTIGRAVDAAPAPGPRRAGSGGRPNGHRGERAPRTAAARTRLTRRRRATARPCASRPSSSSDSGSGGETVEPVTAARTGWNALRPVQRPPRRRPRRAPP